MKQVKAKKHLGQHFLRDMNIAKKIVDSLSVSDNTNVVEIGPGMGVLTQFVINKNVNNFKLIELDGESVVYLKEHYPQLTESIIEGDFLKLDLSKVFDSKYSIIGNFPYNISSQIFFKVLEEKDKVDEVVCMIQKEVAERICEKPGSKTYGILSVLLQAYYDIEYLFTVGEKVFDPPPKVKSAVIRLKRNSVIKLECDHKLFFRVVKTGFNQRRKTLRNSLKPVLNGKILEDEIMNKRPEQLSYNQFIDLTNKIEKLLAE
ncbi:MAG: 16S rRNA (adenine(1518)-N(6)/adenine(1519)-N(6))-dimethyltransferase RsmA [Marinifilaceae bacterium]|jgi:16S rRNA (adenine1518-N6/adenine1519-N6)-dimethyltransferase|nr:16S rRNA (adenine(1518)-N(6)/adenine(1519)-N(6))-dimethyltransferase RsmA [Marinifilaceae bacterium]